MEKMQEVVKAINMIKVDNNGICNGRLVYCIEDKFYNEIILLTESRIEYITDEQIKRHDYVVGNEYAVKESIRDVDWDNISFKEQEKIYDAYYDILSYFDKRKKIIKEIEDKGILYGNTIIKKNEGLENGTMVFGFFELNRFNDIISGESFICNCVNPLNVIKTNIKEFKYNNFLFGEEFLIYERLFPVSFLNMPFNERKIIVESYQKNVKSKVKKI